MIFLVFSQQSVKVRDVWTADTIISDFRNGSIIPMKDRFDQFDNLHHSEQDNFTESDDEHFITDEIIGLDEIARIISEGYQDIRASNPNICHKEEQIDKLITYVLKKKSYRTFEQLMSPFEKLQGTDMQVRDSRTDQVV